MAWCTGLTSYVVDIFLGIGFAFGVGTKEEDGSGVFSVGEEVGEVCPDSPPSS